MNGVRPSIRPLRFLCSKRCFFLLLVAAWTNMPAAAQVPSNIQTQLRPFVHVQFPGIANAPVGLGVFDTGNDNITIAPETNNLVGIGVAVAGDVWQNDNVVGNFTNITAGGFLGGALDGPEGNDGAGDPAHVVAAAARLPNTAPAARGPFAPSLTYFLAGGGGGFANSLINLGTAFVSNVGGGEGALVAEIDPINGQAMPFALRNRNPATANPNPPPANLTPSSLPLDQRASSVSFFTPAIARVPTLMHNANPNFLTSITFNAPVAGGFTRMTAVGGGGNPTGTTLGPLQPTVTLGAMNVFGIPAGNYIPDTGAPNTGMPGGLLGTDNLNKFGQYWDFTANANNGGSPTILLFGPRNADDRRLVGPGVLIGVDREAEGLTRTGVNELRTHGLPPKMDPGDPAFAPTPITPEHAAGLYRTHMTHSNAVYISGVDALGLNGFNGDHLDGVSMGGDRIARENPLYFSVDAASTGLAGVGYGGGVPGQAALGQHMGDVFESSTGIPAIVPGVNRLRFNQDVMGLGSNVGPTVGAGGRGHADNLSALDLDTGYAYRQYGLNQSGVMRNLDPSIIAPGDTRNPDGELAGGNPVRDDVYGVTFDTYFTLDAASPGLGGASPADVLVNNAPAGGAGFHLFAPALTAGLLAQDDIDAIALQRISFQPQLTLHPGLIFAPDPMQLIGAYAFGGNMSGIDPFVGPNSDLMLFSLSPGSPSLGIVDPILGRALSPADVFVTDFDGTFALFASAESLGLSFQDNIDALDSVPEPASVLLVILAAAAMTMRRDLRRFATCGRCAGMPIS